MAYTTTADLFTVRAITVDGELFSETEGLDENEAYATFDDTSENAEAGICVQLISEDGSVVAEKIIGE